MTNKISLYFDPYAWESLHRLVPLLLVSGKPLNELPNMNDVIEGIVVYVSENSLTDERDVAYLINYVQGISIIRNVRPNPHKSRKEKGRMAFRINKRTIDALVMIKDAMRTFVKKGDYMLYGIEELDKELPIKTSDAILIRSCVYFLLSSHNALDGFFMNLYLSTLFDIPPSSVDFEDNYTEGELQLIDEEVKEKLRMIQWDQSVILQFVEPDGIPKLPPEDLGMLIRKPFSISKETILREGIDPHPIYESVAFNFNYMTALIGWVFISLSEIDKVTIYEMITTSMERFDKIERKGVDEGNLSYYDNVERFLSRLKNALTMSIILNDMAIRKKKY